MLLRTAVGACVAALLYVASGIGVAASAGERHSTAGPPQPLPLSALLSPLHLFPLPSSPPPFLCANAGFLRQEIPRSFVLDGVCDCCDGSDERVASRGEHPFFAQQAAAGSEAPALDAPAAPKDGGPGAVAAAAKDESTGSGWGWGGLFSGDAAPSAAGAAASNSAAVASGHEFSPCPNTCGSAAASFLQSFESRVALYARGVERKNALLSSVTGMEEALASVQEGLHSSQEELQFAIAEYKQAKSAHDTPPPTGQNQASHDRLRRAEGAGNRAQHLYENRRWLLDMPVPSLRDRAVQRAPAPLGARKELLLLYSMCWEFAWPQRRFGHFGEHVDWYEMEVCPLRGAMQSDMRHPPLDGKEGPLVGGRGESDAPEEAAAESEDSHEALAASSAAAPGPDESADSTAAASLSAESSSLVADPPPPPELQRWSLGMWVGDIIVRRGNAGSDETASDDAAAESAQEKQQARQPGKAKTKKKRRVKKKPSSSSSSSSSSASLAAPPGSTLSPLEEPSFILPFRGGDPCWQIGPRQSELTLRCGVGSEGGEEKSPDGGRITSVAEDGKCRYKFEAESPLACDEAFLAQLRKQLDDHRKWFARTLPATLPPAPTRADLLSHDEL